LFYKEKFGNTPKLYPEFNTADRIWKISPDWSGYPDHEVTGFERKAGLHLMRVPFVPLQKILFFMLLIVEEKTIL